MPTDPRIWTENPLTSTYPACQAVKAASEQGWEAGYRYLRRLREGIMFERRKLDHLGSLLAAAGPARIDRERFEIDLRSHAITEAFGADLDEVRDPPPEAREAGAVGHTEGKERISFPSAVFIGEDGSRHGVWAQARSPSGDARGRTRGGGEAGERGAARAARRDPPLRPLRDPRARGPGRDAPAGRSRPSSGAWPGLEARSPCRALTGTLWEPA